MHSSISTTIALLFSLTLTSTALAASKKLPFPNNTGQAANDLHIEFVQGVTAKEVNDSYGAFDNYNSTPGSSSAEFDGGTVPAGGSTKIKFENGGPKITVKQWWWTKDGNRIGSKNTGLASAAVSIDQTDLQQGGTVTLTAEATGDDYSAGDFMIDAFVRLPNLSERPIPPTIITTHPGMTCALQTMARDTGPLMPGTYEITYFAQSLESGLVTEGTSTMNLGDGCAPNEQ